MNGVAWSNLTIINKVRLGEWEGVTEESIVASSADSNSTYADLGCFLNFNLLVEAKGV